MIRFPIPILLCLACVTATPAPDAGTPWARCYTPCGMRANDGDCESLQRAEQRIVERLALAVPAWREETICARLKGFELRIHGHDAVIDKKCSPRGWVHGGICISGLEWGTDRSITLSDTDWNRNALAHEIAHVADDSRDGHCPWRLAALQAALYDLAGYVDPSGPDEKLCASGGR